MTNATPHSSSTLNENDDALINTMKSIRELIGYDLHNSRVVFEHDGNEVVFIHNLLSCVRRVYINGEEVFNRFSLTSCFASNTEIEWQGVRYRLFTRMLNLASMAQDVTLLVDGAEVGRQTDPMYGAMRGRQMAHAMVGPCVIGFAIGSGLSWIL